MKMMEYRKSARTYLLALENIGAMECYLEIIINDTTMKQNAYRTLTSLEM